MDAKKGEDYVAMLERQVAHYQYLLEVNNVLNSVLLRRDVGIDALLRYLMEAAAKLTDCEGASVLLWDDAQEKLVFTATSTENKPSKTLVGKAIPLDSLAGTIFKEGRLVEVSDADNDPRHYSEVDQTIQFRTRSLLGVPLTSNNKRIGVLEVVNKRSLPWTDDDRRNLSILAGEAAIAIEVGHLVLDLQNANTELSELDKLKSDFIAIASHELRTPLGIILGYASFLQETEDSSVRMQATKVMDGALQLRRIIESMINLRYIKQKSTELRRHPITLAALMQDIQRDSSSLTNSATYQMRFDVTHPEAQVLVDRSRTVMAIINLVSNAMSFSKSGAEIILRAFVDGDEAYITIIDKGIGIETNQLERIFDEFYQVEDHMTRHHGGLGIGLSITRAIVRAHNGRIWAESAGLGQGATFTIAFPLVK